MWVPCPLPPGPRHDVTDALNLTLDVTCWVWCVWVCLFRNTITLVPPADSNAHRNQCGEETIEFDRVLPPALSQEQVGRCSGLVPAPIRCVACATCAACVACVCGICDVWLSGVWREGMRPTQTSSSLFSLSRGTCERSTGLCLSSAATGGQSGVRTVLCSTYVWCDQQRQVPHCDWQGRDK